MQNLLLIVAGLLVLVILVLAFRVQSLLAIQRGSHENKDGLSNRLNAFMFPTFLVVMGGLAIYYTFGASSSYMLPKAASIHGEETDFLFKVTMAVIGLVVLITHLLLMIFPFVYQYKKDRKAKFYPDNHVLELAWTVVPAIVLTVLVFKGWKVWSNIWKELDEDDKVEVVHVEAIAKQFEWVFRYPGMDGKYGRHDFRKIDESYNVAGLDYSDPENIEALDDFLSKELVLPKGKKVRVKIRAKDVIHSFFLPHFRVKMDAVPGQPTYFAFTPKYTTDEYKEHLRGLPTWADTIDDKPRWERFEYEVVCAEICGKSHYGMKGAMTVLDTLNPDTRIREYDVWFAKQKPNAIFDEDKKAAVIAQFKYFDADKKKQFISKLAELEKIHNNQIEVDEYKEKEFSIIDKLSEGDQEGFFKKANGNIASTQLIVAFSDKHYATVLEKANKIAEDLELPLDLRGLGLTEASNLGFVSDSAATVYKSVSNEYVGRASTEKAFVSIEKTDAYDALKDGKYIVVISAMEPKSKLSKEVYELALEKGYKVFAKTSNVITSL